MSDAAATHRSDEQPPRTLRATIDADALDTAVSLAAALVDECHLAFDDDGLRLYAVDPATVAYVDVTLGRDAFAAYEAADEHVGVALPRLSDVVGMGEDDTPVRIALDAESRALDVRVGSLAYTLATIDPATVRSPPDGATRDLGLAATVTTDAAVLTRAVRAADMVSNHLALGVDDDAFYVEADGDTDDVSLTTPADDCQAFAGGDAHSLFSVDYLRAIDRALPSDCAPTLELGTEKPVRLTATFADGAGSVEYVVSPRLSNY
jgi:proliferating cell nuclear antigen